MGITKDQKEQLSALLTSLFTMLPAKHIGDTDVVLKELSEKSKLITYCFHSCEDVSRGIGIAFHVNNIASIKTDKELQKEFKELIDSGIEAYQESIENLQKFCKEAVETMEKLKVIAVKEKGKITNIESTPS